MSHYIEPPEEADPEEFRKKEMEKDPFEKRIKPVVEDIKIKTGSQFCEIEISPWKLNQYFEDQNKTCYFFYFGFGQKYSDLPNKGPFVYKKFPDLPTDLDDLEDQPEPTIPPKEPGEEEENKEEKKEENQEGGEEEGQDVQE